MNTDIKLGDMVARLQKPGEGILQTLTPFKCNLWHHGAGLASEYIEIQHALRNVDRANLIEEAGDLKKRLCELKKERKNVYHFFRYLFKKQSVRSLKVWKRNTSKAKRLKNA